MLRILVIAISILSGAGLAVQAILNSQLRALVGSALVAAVNNNFMGLCLLLILLLCMGQSSSLLSLREVSPLYLVGGFFGAFYVIISAYATKDLGVLFFLSLILVGQFIAASCIDHFGWFGAQPQHFTLKRAFGILALILGVILVKTE